MSDPERLLTSAPRGSASRALLESKLATEPTDAECDELWRALAHKLPVAAGAAALGAALSSTATSKALGAGAIVKVVALVLVAGSVATAIGVLGARYGLPELQHAAVPTSPSVTVRRSELSPPPPPSPPTPTAADDVAVVPPPPSVPAEPVRQRHIGPRQPLPPPRREADGEVVADVDRSAHAESALLLRAREILRSGDCAGSLAALDAARAHFAPGVLGQEREVLAIESLACAGRPADAAARATAFRRDYPTSPHADAMARFTR